MFRLLRPAHATRATLEKIGPLVGIGACSNGVEH